MKQKKVSYLVALMALMAVTVFTACEKNEVDTTKDRTNEASLSQKLKDAREIAKFHSEGLEFTLNKLTSETRSAIAPMEHFNKSMNKENKLIFVQQATADYMRESDILGNISPENIFNKGYLSLRSAGNYEYEYFMFKDLDIKMKDFLETIIPNPENPEEVDAQITNTVLELEDNSYFLSLPEYKQNIIIVYLAIFEDSYKYWSANGIKWYGNNSRTRGIRDWWKRNKDTILSIAQADGKGAIAGGVGGAAGGAVAGAFAGGVGAGPGALVGGASGAVGGAVEASLMEAMNYEVMADEQGVIAMCRIAEEDVIDVESYLYLPITFGED